MAEDAERRLGPKTAHKRLLDKMTANIAMADSLMGALGFKRVKPKKCKVCREEFTPVRPMQRVCSPVCAHRLTITDREKKAAAAMKANRQATKAKREAMKGRTKWLKEAQAAFNAYIRERDKHLPCVSCGRYHQGSWDAGHYRSVGAAPALRFSEDNCHRQCVPCNQHKSGNAIEYRIGLITRIGVARVEALEREQPPMKYTIEQAKAIKEKYRAKLAAMKAGQ